MGHELKKALGSRGAWRGWQGLGTKDLVGFVLEFILHFEVNGELKVFFSLGLT